MQITYTLLQDQSATAGMELFSEADATFLYWVRVESLVNIVYVGVAKART